MMLELRFLQLGLAKGISDLMFQKSSVTRQSISAASVLERLVLVSSKTLIPS